MAGARERERERDKRKRVGSGSPQQQCWGRVVDQEVDERLLLSCRCIASGGRISVKGVDLRASCWSGSVCRMSKAEDAGVCFVSPDALSLLSLCLKRQARRPPFLTCTEHRIEAWYLEPGAGLLDVVKLLVEPRSLFPHRPLVVLRPRARMLSLLILNDKLTIFWGVDFLKLNNIYIR